MFRIRRFQSWAPPTITLFVSLILNGCQWYAISLPSKVQIDLNCAQHRATWRHKKKDGTIILVDIVPNDIVYEGKHARIVLANDVTE